MIFYPKVVGLTKQELWEKMLDLDGIEFLESDIPDAMMQEFVNRLHHLDPAELEMDPGLVHEFILTINALLPSVEDLVKRIAGHTPFSPEAVSDWIFGGDSDESAWECVDSFFKSLGHNPDHRGYARFWEQLGISEAEFNRLMLNA